MERNYNEVFNEKWNILQRAKERASESNKPKFDLAINLLYLRQDKGNSQAEIAKALHIDQKNYCQWERAQIAPSLYYLIALAKYYGVSVDRLLSPINF